jgi:polyhydroxyalkanoate synthase
LQSLLNPPGNPKAWYMKGEATVEDPDDWAEGAEKHEGSWWIDWAAMLQTKSGNQVKAPKKPGNKKFPSLGPAPGTYVFEP